MKLLVLSDLHVEFSPFTPDVAATNAADVVVLAGDIHRGSQVIPWARTTFPDKPVVLVAGNHEFYSHRWDAMVDRWREEALRYDVHFLEDQAITIEGIRFLGSTLWTDFEFFGTSRVEECMKVAQRMMADYRAISGCSPKRTLERHLVSRGWLERELQEPGHRPVVVTHHYPHKSSTAKQYLDDLGTAAFGSQLPESLIRQTSLWIHGHTHSSHCYDVGQCRVVANPRGYPRGWKQGGFENPEFEPGLLVDAVDADLST